MNDLLQEMLWYIFMVSISGQSTASIAPAATATAGIASFGFTQEQVACVCEVLEQSGNIDRLAR